MPSGILNIAEWSPDQVAEWMSGLAPAVAQYVPALKERGLNGAKLLTLRCDDLEYLGMHIIGHQELLLEAVEHLRNFQYEMSRECVQQLAVRVSAAAAALARALRQHADARLETHSLADVARAVHAVKPLVCWLDRWSLCSGGPLAERKAALLKLALEAATCAQRDRFAEQPARAVAAAAAAAAAVADYIIQEVSDPMILQPASLDAVTLAQGERALGFHVLQSFCGHHQLAHVRFGSPAHASGRVHEGDEIVQVGNRCVIGWGGEAVERACVEAARAGGGGGELALRLRRRGARALPPPPLHARPAPRARLRAAPPPLHALHRYELEFPCVERSPRPVRAVPEQPEEEAGAGRQAEAAAASSSDESDALSPPASPTSPSSPASPSHLHLDRARMYPPKPAAAARRRHSVCGGSPPARRAQLSALSALSVPQFWQELQQRRWDRDGTPENDDSALYRRDKAVSCSTGLQLSPRPRTCLGVPLGAPPAPPAAPAPPAPPPRSPSPRGKLDKSHSTPAYDFGDAACAPPEPPARPEKAGQIRAFQKSSSQLEEALLGRRARRDRADALDNISEDLASSASLARLDRLDLAPDDDVAHADDEVANGNGLSATDVSISITINDDDALDDFPAIDDDCPELAETVNPVLVPDARSTPDSESSLVSPKIVIDEVAVDDAEIAPIRFPKPRLAERCTPPEPPPRPPLRDHVFSTFREPSRDHIRSPVPGEFSREVGRDFPSPREPRSPVASPTRDPIGRDFRMEVGSPALESPSPREAMSPGREAPQYPVLRMVPRPHNENRELTPLKPVRPGNNTVISVPLRHITKHDIKVIANAWREMPPLNGEPESPSPPVPSHPAPSHPSRKRDELSSSEPALQLLDALQTGRGNSGTLSPTSGGVRNIFPTSKSRSLKKKNSILAKRRDISARALLARGALGGAAVGGAGGAGGAGAGGAVWQRVRARSAQQPRWARRHLLLAHNLLYAYKTPECSRADCMIHLEGFTVCAAGEVRSRAHAFKVYHTGTAFYFATDTRDLMLAWIQLIHRAATAVLEPRQMELSKQFSETDYSDTESDTDSTERRSEKDKDREKEREKDKSKFGSLKKLTHRMQRSESQENVSHSTSLDRKYLRFFSRNKSKDEAKAKNKGAGVPVPTEHYRSYRRAAPPPASPPAPPAPAPAPACPPHRASKRIPKPINYIHASNPNLLDFEKSDFIAKPTFHIPKAKVRQVENLTGFVTLEEFMLKKQEEERRQVYSNRVLMGVERGRQAEAEEARELQRRLAAVRPDVLYGALPAQLGDGDGDGDGYGIANPVRIASIKYNICIMFLPVSSKLDEYEKIVYPEDRNTDWRDSLRRNDKVHSGVSSPSHGSSPGESGAGAGPGGVSRLRQMFAARKQENSGRTTQYPHLVCPPTFQPETYSLARLAPRPRPPHPPHPPPP